MEGTAGTGGGPRLDSTGVRLSADGRDSGQTGGTGDCHWAAGPNPCLGAGKATGKTAIFGGRRREHADTHTVGQGCSGIYPAPSPAHGNAGQGQGFLYLTSLPPPDSNPTHPAQYHATRGVAAPQDVLRGSTPASNPIGLRSGAPSYDRSRTGPDLRVRRAHFKDTAGFGVPTNDCNRTSTALRIRRAHFWDTTNNAPTQTPEKGSLHLRHGGAAFDAFAPPKSNPK